MYDLDDDRPQTIGRLRGFHGNYGVFVRSYAYICSLGGEGLRGASETAVLNANYLRALLRAPGIGEYLAEPFDRHCMHEFVVSGGAHEAELGIRTLDLAKRMLDFGVHPPTVYFPLIDERPAHRADRNGDRETLEAFAGPRRDPPEAEHPGDGPQRAVHDAGAAARRGRRRGPAGRAPADVARLTSPRRRCPR